MTHAIYKVITCENVSPFKLRIGFNDGAIQIIDFLPILKGQIYGPLTDLNLFNQVCIDPEVHTLVWPNGADFDPATLHDWPEHESTWLARAVQWGRSSANSSHAPA